MNTRRSLILLTGAFALPLPLRLFAQQKLPRVGWLMSSAAGPYAEITARGFIKGLGEAGLVEGKTVILERRSAEGDMSRYPALARELMAANVDVIFAPGKPMADAAWYASRAVPTVIATVTDPIAVNYARSLARPGLHITGVTTANVELIGKRLQLLTELVPLAKRIGVLIDDDALRSCREEMRQADAAATKLGLTLVRVSASRSAELAGAFARAQQLKVQAMMTMPMTTNHDLLHEIAALGAKARMPMMHDVSLAAEYGGLVSYGPDFEDVFRRAAQYVGRILKGEKPAGMAIEEPREFRFSINLKAAKALGITVPPTIMIRADKVIE